MLIIKFNTWITWVSYFRTVLFLHASIIKINFYCIKFPNDMHVLGMGNAS
jgi:hypothetical protein